MVTAGMGFLGWYRIWLLRYMSGWRVVHASRRSQFAPVIVLQIEFGLPPHSFSWKFSPAPAARKISTKRVKKCDWQDQFDFPLMEGETAPFLSRAFQVCSLVIP